MNDTRLEVLRARAERPIVYPLTRDECLELVAMVTELERRVDRALQLLNDNPDRKETP